MVSCSVSAGLNLAGPVGVVGVKQRFSREPENVLVLGPVEDRRSFPPRRDKSRQPELREVL